MADDDVDDELLEEDVDEPEDIEEGDLDELGDDDDDDILDDDVAVVEDDVEIPDVVPVATPTPSEEDEEDEDDEEADEDDVEASLDVILKEKLVVADDDEPEDTADQDERVETTTKVLPKQPDEFVCQSCFLVKHPSQLADGDKLLCRDCV